MGSLTLTQARDEGLAFVKAVIDDSAFSSMVIVYTDSKSDVPPETTASWMRLTWRILNAEVASLAGGLGTQRYIRTGVIFIQGFFATGGGQVDPDAWAQELLNGIEAKTTAGGIIFRNVRPNEIGTDGPWFQVNVTADFEFDEVK